MLPWCCLSVHRCDTSAHRWTGAGSCTGATPGQLPPCSVTWIARQIFKARDCAWYAHPFIARLGYTTAPAHVMGHGTTYSTFPGDASAYSTMAIKASTCRSYEGVTVTCGCPIGSAPLFRSKDVGSFLISESTEIYFLGINFFFQVVRVLCRQSGRQAKISAFT